MPYVDVLDELGAVEPTNKEIDRALAMLQISLEDVDEADEDIRRGKTFTIEELRHELRAGVRS